MILITLDSIFGGFKNGATLAVLADAGYLLDEKCYDCITLFYWRCTPEEVGLFFKSIMAPFSSAFFESVAYPNNPTCPTP
jgi:hypothetical protein